MVKDTLACDKQIDIQRVGGGLFRLKIKCSANKGRVVELALSDLHFSSTSPSSPSSSYILISIIIIILVIVMIIAIIIVIIDLSLAWFAFQFIALDQIFKWQLRQRQYSVKIIRPFCDLIFSSITAMTWKLIIDFIKLKNSQTVKSPFHVVT